MSHVTSCDTEFKDLECLEKAAEACGLELVRGKTSYHWYGRHMGDYPLPEGFKKEDLGKCDHVLRVKGSDGGKLASKAYEIGVVARGDGKFTLLWDFFSGGYGLMERVSAESDKRREGIGKLQQEYQAAVTRKELKKLKRMGFRIKEVREGGKIRIKAVR